MAQQGKDNSKDKIKGISHGELLSALNAGKLASFYIWEGSEEFIKERTLTKLLDTVPKDTRSLNVENLPPEATAKEVLVTCNALPFMSERRFVISGALPSGEEAQALIAQLDALPDYCTLLYFIRGNADGKLSIVKEAIKRHALVSFEPPTPAEASKWVQVRAKQLGVTIMPDASAKLCSDCGPQMSAISGELEKAVLYVGSGGVITPDVVERVTIKNEQANAFALLELLVAGNKKRTLEELNVLLSKNESATGLAALMSDGIRDMYLAYVLSSRGVQTADIALRINKREWQVNKLLPAAKRLGRRALYEGYMRFSDVSYLQISGVMKDTQALQQAIIDFGVS